MSTLAHIISTPISVLLILSIPNENNFLILVSMITATLVDLDHVYFFLKKRKTFGTKPLKGNLHKARSFFHELLGVCVCAFLTFLMSFKDSTLAKVILLSYLVHIVEDMVIGKSRPFYPLSKETIQLFKLTFKQKVLVDASVILFSLFLWLTYLNVLKF